MSMHIISVIFIGIQLKYEDFDLPFAQPQSDSKIMHFYMYIYRSYLPYNRQNGIRSSNRKFKEFEFKFLIICKYWNLVKKIRV